MFQFSGFALLTQWQAFNLPGCPIRISTDLFVCANPRSFSQLTTSFFASESLGIRHTPLTISFLIYLLKHSLCSVFSLWCLLPVMSMIFSLAFSYRRFAVGSFRTTLLIAYGLLLIADSWRIRESNPWPPACKAGALASWANSPCVVQYFIVQEFNVL